MTIAQVVARWDEMIREGCYYDNSIPGRCLPWASHHGRDCSTFAADGILAGFPDSIDLCSNSFSQAAWCYNADRPAWFTKRFGPGVGTFITYEQAQFVVCLGFRGSDFGRRPDSTGDGHTECCLGQGAIGRPKRTVGAHSHSTGCGYDEDGLDTHHLSCWAVPPPFLTEMAGPQIDAATLAAIKRIVEWRDRVSALPLHQGDTNGDVTTLVKLLILHRYLGKKRQTNTYNRYVRAAVGNLKKARALPNRDGRVFGADAAHALLHPVS